MKTIGIIACDAVFDTVESLNARKSFELQRVTGRSVHQVCSSIEEHGNFSHVLIDIDALPGNRDFSFELVERLGSSCPATKLIVLAPDHDESSYLVRDFASVGIKDIVIEDGSGMNRRLTEIFLRDDVLRRKKKREDSTTQGATNRRTKETQENELPPAKELPKEEHRAENTESSYKIPLPTQIPRAQAKNLTIPAPPPAKSLYSAVTIAVTGAGSRVGTTTQAMQIALYLKAHGETVGIIQMSEGTSLAEYIPVFTRNSFIVDEDQYQINDLTLFKSGRSIGQAKNMFRYLVCDYGNYNELSDVSAFLDKDVKVVVGGTKPWELEEYKNIFKVNDTSIHFIFSFVPPVDMDEVRGLMLDSASRTHFAAYAPDYWQYCGADDTYFQLIQPLEQPPRQSPVRKKKRPIIPFFNKGG